MRRSSVDIVTNHPSFSLNYTSMVPQSHADTNPGRGIQRYYWRGGIRCDVMSGVSVFETWRRRGEKRRAASRAGSAVSKYRLGSRCTQLVADWQDHCRAGHPCVPVKDRWPATKQQLLALANNPVLGKNLFADRTACLKLSSRVVMRPKNSIAVRFSRHSYAARHLLFCPDFSQTRVKEIMLRAEITDSGSARHCGRPARLPYSARKHSSG